MDELNDYSRHSYKYTRTGMNGIYTSHDRHLDVEEIKRVVAEFFGDLEVSEEIHSGVKHTYSCLYDVYKFYFKCPKHCG